MLRATHSPDAGSWLPVFGRWVGVGVFALLLALPPPEGLPVEGWRTAAVTSLMAIFWLTEALAIPATALLPIVLFPALGVVDATTAAAPYASDILFLFLGGFLIAAAMERCGVHRRIALAIIAQVGTSPGRIVFGFMAAAAFLSMWISNSATTAMMLPIAIAIGEVFDQEKEGEGGLATPLLLGLAYAATIGGTTTLIGTPPNAVLAASTAGLLGREIGFLHWMAVALPIAGLLLPITWFLLTRILYPCSENDLPSTDPVARLRRDLGPAAPDEIRTAIIFSLTVAAWILRSEKVVGSVVIPGLESWIPGLRDSTIAMAGALLLFVIPRGRFRGERLLDWDAAQTIPWGVLVLVGGGLSMTTAIDRSGLAAWLGTGGLMLEGLSPTLIVLLVAGVIVFLTEFTSNVATASVAMPILAGAAAGLGIPAIELMSVAALSASMAFMLPVATPPNAIVYGSGTLSIAQMSRAGFALNLCSILLITLLAPTLVTFFFRT